MSDTQSYRIIAHREGSPLRSGGGEFKFGDVLGTLELDARVEINQLVNGLRHGVIVAELVEPAAGSGNKKERRKVT